MPAHPIFSSRIATLLTMVGVAVGLGNVWRFPYMMGRYGGSAFLLVYLGFVLLLAVPALSAEWSLGRACRRGPLGAFRQAFGRRSGTAVGVALLITVLVADSYYLVVIGQMAYTAWFSVANGFGEAQAAAFSAGLASGPLQYGITLGVLLASLVVIHRGLRGGIELVSKLFVPFFGAVVVYLIVAALQLKGAPTALVQFLKPDFAALNATDIFAAMGQAFFSLGLGGTFFIMYGSYLPDGAELPRSALWTALGDAGSALLAGMFIVPTVLVFGIDLAAGPGLVFETLPALFAAMPGGRALGSFFLVALTMVAFLSNIAALEVLAGTARYSRVSWLRGDRALVIIGLAEAALIFPSAIQPSLIAVLDLIFGSGMQTLGSGLAVIALTWGLGRATTLHQLGNRRWSGLWYQWLRWVVPGALLAILAQYLHSVLVS